jgi:ppGpp synthetase/RelA/SpoT-type nucleotidyltranferase
MSTPAQPRRQIAYTADGIWRLQPAAIRRFIETEPDYLALCREVAYILQKRSESVSVETASISWRSKSLNSFLEKIQRKAYVDPFEDLTDRAGVRVVCHYTPDCEVVSKIVAAEFEVLEAEDKTSTLGIDKFGYSARHFLVKLGPQSVGARYDYLRDLKCEIQIRTALQDAWAVLQHHLFYKLEYRIPTELLRSANSLSALLEHVDQGFERLRQQRDEYFAQVRESRTDRDRFLLNELTLESFAEYLSWRFSDRPIERSEGQLRRVLADLDRQRFRLLSDLDGVIERFAAEIEEIGRMVDVVDLTANEQRPSVYDAVWAVALEEPKMLAGSGLPLHWRDALTTVLQTRIDKKSAEAGTGAEQ